jgi:type I restriction enzyme S subunit
MQNNAGSNREGINYTQIKGIRIPYFNNDKEFTELNKFVFKSSKKIEMDQIKLNKLQKLKKGLMQDLLSGKKRVTTLLK